MYIFIRFVRFSKECIITPHRCKIIFYSLSLEAINKFVNVFFQAVGKFILLYRINYFSDSFIEMYSIGKSESYIMPRILKCELCGNMFQCGSPDGCWCSSVEVDKKKITELSEIAEDCVCETCLKR